MDAGIYYFFKFIPSSQVSAAVLWSDTPRLPLTKYLHIFRGPLSDFAGLLQ